MLDAVKAIFGGKFTASYAYIRKKETFQISDLICYLKKKREQIIPKGSRRKELIKMRAKSVLEW